MDSILFAVGSANHIKVRAVETALAKIFPDRVNKVRGCEVNSGVSAQPMSDRESIEGATNRASLALTAAKADFGIGMEGGLSSVDGKWFNCGWIVVRHRSGRQAIASTVKIEVSDEIMQYVLTGSELEVALEKVVGVADSGQGQGYFGVLTEGHLTRESTTHEGLIAALVPLLDAVTMVPSSGRPARR